MLKSTAEHSVGVIRSKPAFPYCHNLQQESSPLVSSTICSPPSQEPLTGGSGTLTRTKRLRLICILTNKQTNCGRIRWTWSTSGPIQTGRGGKHCAEVIVLPNICLRDAGLSVSSGLIGTSADYTSESTIHFYQRLLFLQRDEINSSAWAVSSIHRALIHFLGLQMCNFFLFSRKFSDRRVKFKQDE